MLLFVYVATAEVDSFSTNTSNREFIFNNNCAYAHNRYYNLIFTLKKGPLFYVSITSYKLLKFPNKKFSRTDKCLVVSKAFSGMGQDTYKLDFLRDRNVVNVLDQLKRFVK